MDCKNERKLTLPDSGRGAIRDGRAEITWNGFKELLNMINNKTGYICALGVDGEKKVVLFGLLLHALSHFHPAVYFSASFDLPSIAPGVESITQGRARIRKSKCQYPRQGSARLEGRLGLGRCQGDLRIRSI